MTLPKLTPLQWDLLCRVCESNGGGVAANGEAMQTLVSLARRGLVQGKSGALHRIVHTDEGLSVWRELCASAEICKHPTKISSCGIKVCMDCGVPLNAKARSLPA